MMFQCRVNHQPQSSRICMAFRINLFLASLVISRAQPQRPSPTDFNLSTRQRALYISYIRVASDQGNEGTSSLVIRLLEIANAVEKKTLDPVVTGKIDEEQTRTPKAYWLDGKLR